MSPLCSTVEKCFPSSSAGAAKRLLRQPPDQAAGDDTGDQEHRSVVEQAAVFNNQDRDQKLPDVVCHAAGDADTDQTEIGMLLHQRHDGQAECSSGQTVKDAEHVSKEKADDDNPDHGDQDRIAKRISYKDIENCQIGQPKLNARDSGEYRNQRLDVAENNGKC